jgi:FkbM family methyltransferase
MKFFSQHRLKSKLRSRVLDSLEYRLNLLTSKFSIGLKINDLREPIALGTLKRNLQERFLDILVVDIGASVDEFESPYYNLFEGFQSLKIIGFDPQTDKTPSGENIKIYPHVIGDGNAANFHIFNDFRCSSLLDLNYDFCSSFNHISELELIAKENITTQKLDNLLKEEFISLLKIDVQGAELMVLKGAVETLKKTSTIILEVEFNPIYSNQPLFVEISRFLSDQNFEFVDFLDSRRYTKLNSLDLTSSDQLLWSDGFFVNKNADKGNFLQIAAVCLSLSKYSMASYYLDLANEF